MAEAKKTTGLLATQKSVLLYGLRDRGELIDQADKDVVRLEEAAGKTLLMALSMEMENKDYLMAELYRSLAVTELLRSAELSAVSVAMRPSKPYPYPDRYREAPFEQEAAQMFQAAWRKDLSSVVDAVEVARARRDLETVQLLRFVIPQGEAFGKSTPEDLAFLRSKLPEESRQKLVWLLFGEVSERRETPCACDPEKAIQGMGFGRLGEEVRCAECRTERVASLKHPVPKFDLRRKLGMPDPSSGRPEEDCPVCGMRLSDPGAYPHLHTKDELKA